MPLTAAIHTRRRLLTALLVLLLLGTAGAVFAHPADMFLQNHTVTLRPDGFSAEWSIYPGALLAQLVWDEADTDLDEAISAAEAEAWAALRLADYTASVDGAPLDWVIESVTWPGDIVALQLGDELIVITLRAVWPDSAGDAFTLTLDDAFAPGLSINWFTLQGEDGVTFTTPDQVNGRLDLPLSLAAASGADASDAAAAEDARNYWDSGMPSLSTSGGEAAVAAPEDSPSAVLTGFVQQQDSSPGFLLLALSVSLVLGAVHALTPGHGKTLVAAYLVGSRGTLKHAVALGGIVTLTHTGSVLALGLLTLAASRFLLPTTLFPLLEAASGLLIIGMGVGLLWRRWGGFRAVQQYRDRQTSIAAQAAAVSAHPAPAPPESPEANASKRRITINEPIETRQYDELLPDDLSFGMVQWRSLVALGISGGLVPCPDAIAILLVAVALNRIPLGLVMILAFSLGLAVILTAIGIAMVHSRRLFARMEIFNRVAPALPVVSAVIVLALGVVLTVTAITGASAYDLSPQETIAQIQADAPFNVERASVVYLSAVPGERSQLYIQPVSGDQAIQLTDLPSGVWDFALSPDFSTIAYTSAGEEDGSVLWTVASSGLDPQRLLDCPNAYCQNITWMPDSRRLVYERIPFAQEPTADNPEGLVSSTLWWIDVDSGETEPLFRDLNISAFNPRWSADGQWLSYSSATTNGIQLYNLEDGRSDSLPSQTGIPAEWHPGEDWVIFTDVVPEGQRMLTHLFRYDLNTGELLDLSGEGGVEDTWAAWAPSGETIVVTRRLVDGDNLRPGNNIWRLSPDGSDAERLTDVENTLHLTPRWAPDGRHLLFVRYALATEFPDSEMWVLDTETGETRLIGVGRNAVWLP